MKKAVVLSILFVVVLLAVAVTAEAQQPKKGPRLGYLSPFDPTTEFFRTEGVRLALRKLGYIEGQNIAIEYRYGQGKQDRLPELATELVALKVDIIVAAGPNRTIQAVKNATQTIPIIMAGLGSDPVAAGFVESLARPGGNVTGVTNLSIELSGKRLELLKEAVPKLARVAVLYDPAGPAPAREVKEHLPAAARTLGLTIHPWEIRDAADISKVFAALTKERPDALYRAGAGTVMLAIEKRTVAFALKSRLPSLAVTPQFVEAGGLMYYGANRADRYKRFAYFVDRVLKGAKPADLPVEQPTKFELVINLKTAKQIGVTIPQSMLYRADKVIK